MKDELKSVMITTQTPREYIERLATRCDRCGHCCSYDSGIFLEEDIRRIADYLGIPQSEFIRQCLVEKRIFNKKVHKAKLTGKGKPYGACLFQDDKSCIIHDVKPLHCKLTSGCLPHGQELNIWYMLNFIVDPKDPQAIREWAIYLQSHPTIPGGELNQIVPDPDERESILSHRRLK
jgi:Fe-S-cluster containining protein